MAEKSDDKEKIYKATSAKEAKLISKNIAMIDNLKFNLMYDILKCKFSDLELKEKLLETEGIIGMIMFGDCRCNGRLKKDKSSIII